jgi:predicted enzyme related to lactoylglutathione lyase
MPEMTKYEPGMFCWIELLTSDRAAAQKFYSGLFGWTPLEIPMDGGEPYVMQQKNGKTVGAMYQNTNMAPNWMSYVAVASADDSARKAKDLGATLLMEPFDVMGLGRMAVVQDPQGAAFSIWQATGSPGIEVRNELGTLVWNELMTTDAEAARTFYGALFDWKMKASPEYTELHVGETAVGGLMQIGPEWQGMPSHWQPYFLVDDCDATVQKAQSLGTTEVFGPFDLPSTGRLAVLKDPHGAAFALIKPAM